MIFRHRCRQFVVLGVIVLAVQPAPAQTFTWDGGLSHGNFTFFNTWATPNNWVGGVAPVSAAATNIVITQSGIWTTADQNIANPFLLNTLSFNGANNFTALTDEPLQFNFANGTSPFIAQNTTNAITVGNPIAMTSSGLTIGGVQGGSLTLSGNVTGPGVLIVETSGTTVLTGNNSYTGGTLIELGVIQAGTSGALGTGPLTFAGGTLQYGPGNNTDYSARFGANQLYSIDTNSQAVTFASALQGSSGVLKKLGAGTLTLSNTANSYAGGTILDNGILAVATDSVLGGASAGVTFAGGTLEATASFTSARAMAFNGAGGGFSVDTGKTLTLSGALTGPGLLAKVGFGTLILNGSPAVGGYEAVRGTLDFLGVTLPAGFVTLTADAGATIQYDAGTNVAGGFLHGPGAHVVTGGAVLNGSTTYNSTVVNATGAGSFINFTNGGSFNVTAGAATPVSLSEFTNQGSGSITLGAVSAATAADFQSYGTLTLTPAAVGSNQQTLLTNTGTSAMFFNGGSRTFIGTPTTATSGGQPTFVAGMDLEGKNLVIAGGLFVNNGFVSDFSATKGSIIVDFGALYKGAGFTGVSIVTQNGGKVQAGNSPGASTFASLTIGPGALNAFNWEINDAGPSPTFPSAKGVGGPQPNGSNQVSGWSQEQAIIISQGPGQPPTTGDLTWTASSTAGNQFQLALFTLMNPSTVGQENFGPMADFDPLSTYMWPFLTYSGTYTGPTDSATLTADTLFDTSQFLNSGVFGDEFQLELVQNPGGFGGSIDIVYPVPEPGSLALIGAATVAGWCRRRRITASSA